MNEGSHWYQLDDALLAEIKRGRSRTRVPTIAGYEQLRELRRGGQGIVYTGEQRSTRRRVAIKVLLEGPEPSGVARRRFEREIDLVAGLKHPHIVSVYDSGQTDDARPYLVMEYIEGQPLDEHVASLRALGDIRGIVELMAQVSEAVQHAHQRGVIHRDLKPSNIRVDARGEPHVLDFGLAKLSVPALALMGSRGPGGGPRGGAAGAGGGADGAEWPGRGATLSMSGQFLGSLAWASPEQCAGEVESLDVRTDVYALGVMLYQALSGKFPYPVDAGLRRTLEHIVSTPPAPLALGEGGGVGGAGGADELSTIVLKCLSKESSRRYQSAGDLAADLRRYLAGERVLAKGDST